MDCILTHWLSVTVVFLICKLLVLTDVDDEAASLRGKQIATAQQGEGSCVAVSICLGSASQGSWLEEVGKRIDLDF